jgi:uncharacterized protein with NRDE domain
VCLIVMLVEVHPDYPLVVAANRDEFYARRAAPPQRLEGGVIAGLDLEGKPAPGSWMGVSGAGRLVAITNHRTGRPSDPAKRTRGEIVLGALRAADATAWVAALDPGRYNPFNLLYGDARGLKVAYGREVVPMTVEDVPAGIHVLPSGPLDAPDFPKVARIRELVAPHVRLGFDQLVPRLHAALSDHAAPGLDAVCIHTTAYGTRSSAIVALAPGRAARYLYTEGPPCTSPLLEVGDLAG